MNETVQKMTRQQMNEAINTLLGGSLKPTEPPPCQPGHIPPFWAQQNDWEWEWFGGPEPGQWKTSKDYCGDIEAAWGLRDVVFDDPDERVGLAFGDYLLFSLPCAWFEIKTSSITQFLAQAFYYAKTGKRVEIVEDEAPQENDG